VLLSSLRVARHGPPPSDASVWWAQMQSVATELGITITLDDWPLQQPARLDQ